MSATGETDLLTILNSLLHEGGIEGYITFFRKRIEIEEEYQASLNKLATRQHDLERRLYGEPHQHLFHDQSSNSNSGGGGGGASSSSGHTGEGVAPAGASGGAPGAWNSYVGGPDSVRQAWREITTNVAHEAALRKEWIKHLREQVVEPLEKFRHSKERTLSRIRDDLRSSFADHKEYSGTVQRLKRNYERKCEEVHQLHQMQEANEYRDRVIEESQRAVTGVGLRGGDDWEHVGTGADNSPTNSEGSNAGSTGPSSAAPLVRKKSGEGFNPLSNPASPPPGATSSLGVGGGNKVLISGATSVALKDTATPTAGNPLQARGNDVLHALRSNTTNLIQRLNSRKDKQSSSSSPSLSMPSGSGAFEDAGVKSSALRSVKAKREAEDADRDYRKGVFHLDTLRLRKEQVIRGARRAAEEMLYEMAGEAKEAFGFFIDETRIASMKRVSICDHAGHLVNKITPDEDASRFAAGLPKDYTEPKVLYENAFIGPCRSLLFGVALTDYVASNPANGLIPLIVKRCVEEIDRRGRHLEGIYRISGKMQGVTMLVHEIEKDEDAFRFDEQKHDAYTISGVLKLYLRQLPIPLFTFPLPDRIAFSNSLDEHASDGYTALVKRIRKLPPSHQATLKHVCAHLARVAACSDENKMPVSNLGLVFAPAVFSEDPAQVLPTQAWKDSVMDVLITHHEELFEGLPLAEPSTPHRGGRTSFGGGRPVSPSARKSLEAERYESYSRSVSPSRGFGLGVGGSEATLSTEAMERSRSLKLPLPHSHMGQQPSSQQGSPMPSPSQGLPGGPYRPMMASPAPPPASTSAPLAQDLAPAPTPKRKFSLRKKSNSGSSGEPSTVSSPPPPPPPPPRERPDRPETILIPGPQYVSATAAAQAAASGHMVTSPTMAADLGIIIPPTLPPGAMPPTPPGDAFATPRSSLTRRDRAASDLAGKGGNGAGRSALARRSAEQLAAQNAGLPPSTMAAKARSTGTATEQKRAASG